jgi:chromosome partitioning protein
MIVVAVTNQKGGVGKTTTALHLSAALAMAGQRVLACDLDPQSNLTMGSGINIDSVERAMPQVLVTRRCTLAEVVQSTPLGYDIAPADPDLAIADVELIRSHHQGWERGLQRALLSVRGSYDWCVIDCPPSLGPLTLNALHAADGLLVPVVPEMYPVKGLQRLILTIGQVQEQRPDLGIIGLVPSMVRKDRAHAQMLQTLLRLFSEMPVGPIIPASSHIAWSAWEVTTVFDRAPRSTVAQAYRELADFVMRSASVPMHLRGRGPSARPAAAVAGG